MPGGTWFGSMRRGRNRGAGGDILAQSFGPQARKRIVRVPGQFFRYFGGLLLTDRLLFLVLCVLGIRLTQLEGDICRQRRRPQ